MDSGAKPPATGERRDRQRQADASRAGDVRRLEGFNRAALDSSMLTGTVGRHMQLGPGRLQATIDRLRFNRTGLRATFFSTAVRAVIDAPLDVVTLGFALEAPEPFLIAGERVPRGTLNVFGAGQVHDVTYPAGATAVTLAMPVALYAQQIAAGSLNGSLHRPAQGLHQVPGEGHPIRGQVDGPELGRLRDVVSLLVRPEDGAAAITGDPGWRANAERALLDAFFGALATAPGACAMAPAGRPRPARAIVLEAEAWMNRDPGSLPSIPSLCDGLGISRRTLERAFRDMFNIGPAHYLRVRALNAAREQLLRCRPAPGIVTRIAVDNGFWHMGRFSGAYRTLFGERPIDTLARVQQGNVTPPRTRGIPLSHQATRR